MALNKTTLRNKVIEITGRSDKGSLIDYGLDLSLKNIFRTHSFRELYDTVSLIISSGVVSLPNDFRTLIEARYSSGNTAYSLVVKSGLWVKMNYPDIENSTTGIPKYCYISGGNLILAPKPEDDSESIQITYKKTPSFNLNIDHMEDIILAYTVALVFRSIDMPDVALYWDNEFNKSLMLAIREDRETNVYWKAEGVKHSEENNFETFIRTPI